MVDVAGPVAAVTMAAPQGSLALGATITAAPAAATLTAPQGGLALGVTITASPASATAAMNAAAVEAYVIDRSGDQITLTLLTDIVPNQPGSVLAQVGQGEADSTAYFFLDGATTSFAEVGLDADGAAIVSLSVNNLTVGAHDLLVSNDPAAATPNSEASFTVLVGITVDAEGGPGEPPTPPTPGPTVLYWTFRDYVDMTELYTFPTNPSQMDSPPSETPLSVQPATSPAGNVMLFEGTPNPPVWRFRGDALTQAHVEALQYWAAKQQRIYITDHFGRQFTVKVNTLGLSRVRDVMRAWHHTYEFTVTILKIETAA